MEQTHRTDWFTDARFGMFLHWGLYAIPARGEWVMSDERIPAARYSALAREFDPRHFDAAAWAGAAREAGMRYVVLTAKHHDGFCLFDSALTDYKSTNTPFGRDVVRELTEAARAEGLRVGLYYSLLDWHHPDYPKFADLYHPMRGNPAFRDEKTDFSSYLDYLHGQVEELVTNYGKIDLLWFDYAYGELRGEAWRGSELLRMVRRHQPDVVVDNRLETSGEGFGSLVAEHPGPCCGDFVSPEQIIPPEGIRSACGARVPWELCTTMNNAWGYDARDRDWKPAGLLIRKLTECVSKGGNLILNVGPDAEGRFPAESAAILRELGGWMAQNSRSIYGCGAAELPKPEWGRYTRAGSRLYAHVFEPPIGPLALTGLRPEQILRVRRLADGSEVQTGESWITKAYEGVPFVCLGALPHYTYPLPDARDTVLEITLKEEPV